MIQWDDEQKVMTDSMGYPISRTEALAYRNAITQHLKKSAADLAAVANKKLKKDMPHYDPYPPEKFE